MGLPKVRTGAIPPIKDVVFIGTIAVVMGEDRALRTERDIGT